MSDTVHTCCVCGHQWESLDRQTEKKVRQAAKVNKTGPYCSLCHHLEMADRHAHARGYEFLYDALLDFLIKRAKTSPSNPAYSTDLRLLKTIAEGALLNPVHTRTPRSTGSQHQSTGPQPNP